MSSSVYEEAKNILINTNISNRHTFFQLKHFVLGKEITTQSKMRKCIKEIDARFESLNNLKSSIDEANDDVRLLEIRIEKLQKKKKNDEIKEIQIRKLNRKKNSFLSVIDSLDKKLKECEEEINFFTKAYKQLEKIEPLKDYDDLEENKNFWNEHFSQELQLRLLLQKPLDLELVKCILSLDKDSPIRLEMIGILENIQNKALEYKKEIKNIKNE